jgi:hypothetical protein
VSLAAAVSLAKGLGLDTRTAYQKLSAASLRAAIREQGLDPLCEKLREIRPDLSDQYTIGFDQEEYARYWEIKMRSLQAWQVRCALDAIDRIGRRDMVLADIGDSSGNHGDFIKALAKVGQVSRVISVNLDPVAVEKVRARGGDAVLCRAEELDLQGLKADLFLSFETIEHLTDPLRFLHALATKGSAQHLLMTVPYRKESRFGGAHLRMSEANLPARLVAEEVHIYEFSPEDWLLLARFAGFKPVFTSTYLQYPLRSPLRATAPLWRRTDFEGFFGAFLERDLSLTNRYADW